MSHSDEQSLLDYKRLRWRCRRGMRELDVLLTRYLDDKYAQAPLALQQAFCGLLEQEDDQLWDWLLGRSVPASSELQAIVRLVSAGHEG